MASIVTAMALISAALGDARAQAPPTPPPPITSVPANTALASSYAAFDLGTNYLYSSSGQGGLAGLAHMFGTPNPNGGGAPDTAPNPRYRAWAEGYNLAARNEAVGNVAGDSRHSAGAVAGFGMLVAPGITLNTSIDQSHTNINVMGQPQHAGYDLNQIGVSGAIESGAWTVSAALVRGFAEIHSTRHTLTGPATAGYNGNVWGGLADVRLVAQPHRSLQRSRRVPAGHGAGAHDQPHAHFRGRRHRQFLDDRQNHHRHQWLWPPRRRRVVQCAADCGGGSSRWRNGPAGSTGDRVTPGL